MRTPKRKIWLIVLAITLAMTSGHRILDQVGIDSLIADQVIAGPLGVMGVMVLPFFAVPFWAVLSWMLLMEYPPDPIRLFHWRRDPEGSQVFWTLFFGLLVLMPLLEVWGIARSMYQLVNLGFGGRVLADAAFNLIAALGAVYVCLCYRALACR